MTSALNQQSENSVLGETADSRVPADGTGKSHGWLCVGLSNIYRSDTARSLARAIQGCTPKQIQQGTELDQNHQRDGGWAG